MADARGVSLTALLLRSHGSHSWEEPGSPMEWHPDHVLLDDTDGTVAALAFEAMGAPRVTIERALFVPQREASGPDAIEDLRYLQSFASATGATLARPGSGTASSVHRRGIGAPARVLAGTVPGLTASGALGMLALPASAVECAAAMTGEPLPLFRPPVVGVELEGAPDPGVSGIDVLVALDRALAGEAAGAVLEFHGTGIAFLPMADRFTVAAHAPRVTGALTALFPSDDRTRAWLRACGRDADWRRFEGGGAGHDLSLRLDLSQVRPARAEGARVRVGPFAEDEDVLALARALAQHERKGGARLEVVLPGRAALDAWTRGGALAAFESAGALLLDRGDAAAATRPEDALLLGGDPSDPEMRESGVWTCAAHLLGITPAEAMVSAGEGATVAVNLSDDLLGPDGGLIERGAHHRRLPLLAPFEEPERAQVLIDAGPDAGAARLLPWGPRVWTVRADDAELAAALFRTLDPTAGARAAAAGRSVVVAGERYGGGRHSEALARATAALGVRAVVAVSYADGHDRLLALHGVLPLVWLAPADRREVRPGDEVELSPPLGGSTAGGRLALRHLTRGFALDVRCTLAAPLPGIALAGGLVRLVRELAGGTA